MRSLVLATLLAVTPAWAQVLLPGLAGSTPSAPPAASTPPPPAAPPSFTAGYAQDTFYLRSSDDNFILIPSGRLQVDFLGYEDAGDLKQPYDTFFLRRARIELYGTVMKHFDFQLGAEYTNTTAPVASDDFINVNYTRYANVQVGQFDVPFTMENRTSDKYTDLQERSVAVRGFAYPENKSLGAMVWGQPEGRWAYWSAGLFNGEGQNVFVHHSNAFDFAGRAWISPTGLFGVRALKNVWLGASLLAGDRAWSAGSQLDHATLSDQARFNFFVPTFTGPKSPAGVAPPANNIHMGQSGSVVKWAVELNAPVGPLVLKSELIHVDEGTREVDTSAKNAVVRTGNLSGTGAYVRLSYFPFGDPLINGLGGQQLPPHLFGQLGPNTTADALQLVLEYDHVGFTYSADLGGATTLADPLVGSDGLDVLGLGANYWLTKRVRLTANVLYNFYSGAILHPLSGQTSYEFTGRIALAL